ncbi:bifunctional DNA primase/polymerase [Candidatus Bathyarchaeota archaeon]|nr:bifunctional DNA primase/polymerase [Candidatus Bathyarchaeota archaeon]
MSTLEVAQRWHSLGVSCIPILFLQKKPALSSWKQYQDELPSEADLRAWFDGSGYSIAVITGRGLVIVDFDDMARHSEWINSLPAERLAALNTYRVKTARGFHYYWWLEESCDEWHGEGVDVKSRGYCLCPPSVHPSGIEYRGYGRIEGIGHIEHITDLLPDYKPRQEWQQPSPPPSQRDIFDEAMREHLPSGMLELAKQKITYEDLLPSLSKGRGVRYALCPIHHDTQPSLAVFEDWHWYCFACFSHGRDALDLFATMNHINITEAIERLCKK